jgi:Flp pilus assembly protein TadG
MTGWTAILRDRSGVASIEAALLTSLLLVPMLGGAADAGLVLYNWGKVTRAEQAGLLSALGNGASPSTMLQAALTAYGNAPVKPSLQASVLCYCLPTATAYRRAGAGVVSCATTCGAGDTLAQFATLSVSTTVKLPLPLPLIGFASPFAINTSATARLQ